jgi:hypothetical protein
MPTAMATTQDPSAVLDWGMSWSSWLGTDTITTSTWTVQTGLTKGADTHDATTTTVWLSGGTLGTRYAVTNRVVTAGGRTDERTFHITIKDR